MSGVDDTPGRQSINILLALLLFALAGRPAGIHRDDLPPGYSRILYLVDTSYSMGVTMPGSRLNQAEIARGLIAASIEQHAGAGDEDAGAGYALAVFSGPDSFSVLVPFTADPGRITAALPGLEYWDITDIESALEAAAKFMRPHASGPSKIVLVSDGVQTAGVLYSLPQVKAVYTAGAPVPGMETEMEAEVEVELLSVPLPFNRPAEERWKRWMTAWQKDETNRTEPAASTGENSPLPAPQIIYMGSSEVLVEADQFEGSVFSRFLKK
ncbi:MAG: VWA domain-containing protein [Spirochaetota bacterium]|nr:VWA domain-containing protein [Spirochaetota bacterium]